MPTTTPLIDSLKRAAARRARHARGCAAFVNEPNGGCDTHQAFAFAIANWRRRRDAECAVSRLMDDGRHRRDRAFGSSTWTVSP